MVREGKEDYEVSLLVASCVSGSAILAFEAGRQSERKGQERKWKGEEGEGERKGIKVSVHISS